VGGWASCRHHCSWACANSCLQLPPPPPHLSDGAAAQHLATRLGAAGAWQGWLAELPLADGRQTGGTGNKQPQAAEAATVRCGRAGPKKRRTASRPASARHGTKHSAASSLRGTHSGSAGSRVCSCRICMLLLQRPLPLLHSHFSTFTFTCNMRPSTGNYSNARGSLSAPIQLREGMTEGPALAGPGSGGR